MFAIFYQKIKDSNVLRLTVGGWIVLSLLAIRHTTSHKMWQLPSRAQDFVTLSSSVIIESFPFVILGILLSILIQVWLPKNFIIKYLPRQPFIRKMCISLLGVFLPVCECGNVPLARGMIVQGFTAAESLVFLLAAPILNPVTILTTHQAFGGDNTILVTRLLGGLLIANTVGWLFGKHQDPESLLSPKFAASCRAAEHHDHSGKTAKSLDIFIRESSNILPALFVGSAVAGLVQVVVPRDILLTLGSNPVWSVLAMMLLAFIVSICSNVDAFFILAFSNTFTVGSVVSFLVFGPIIDIKMLSLMRTTYKPKVLLQITVIVALISALMGLVVNYAF